MSDTVTVNGDFSGGPTEAVLQLVGGGDFEGESGACGGGTLSVFVAGAPLGSGSVNGCEIFDPLSPISKSVDVTIAEDGPGVDGVATAGPVPGSTGGLEGMSFSVRVPIQLTGGSNSFSFVASLSTSATNGSGPAAESGGFNSRYVGNADFSGSLGLVLPDGFTFSSDSGGWASSNPGKKIQPPPDRTE